VSKDERIGDGVREKMHRSTTLVPGVRPADNAPQETEQEKIKGLERELRETGPKETADQRAKRRLGTEVVEAEEEIEDRRLVIQRSIAEITSSNSIEFRIPRQCEILSVEVLNDVFVISYAGLPDELERTYIGQFFIARAGEEVPERSGHHIGTKILRGEVVQVFSSLDPPVLIKGKDEDGKD